MAFAMNGMRTRDVYALEDRPARRLKVAVTRYDDALDGFRDTVRFVVSPVRLLATCVLTFEVSVVRYRCDAWSGLTQ